MILRAFITVMSLSHSGGCINQFDAALGTDNLDGTLDVVEISKTADPRFLSKLLLTLPSLVVPGSSTVASSRPHNHVRHKGEGLGTMKMSPASLGNVDTEFRSTGQAKRTSGPQMAIASPFSAHCLFQTMAICTLPTCLGFWKSEYGVSYAYGLAMAGMGLLMIRASITTLALWHAAALLIYGLRLTFFLLWRELSLQRFRDFREKIEERATSKGGRLKRIPFVFSCSVLYMCMAAPTLVTASATNYGVLASVLVAIEWVGLGLAAVGDFTKSWVKAKRGEDTLVTGGVFRIFRHPNYTGEQLLWTANMLVGFAVAVNNRTFVSKASIGWLLASVLGWLGICFVLAQATRGLEKRQAERYGNLEEFQKWRASSWSGFALAQKNTPEEQRDSANTPEKQRDSANSVPEIFGHAEDGNLQAVKECLASGTHVDLQDSTGTTALLIATRQGHQQVIEALLESGADVNKSGARGYTPLMYAAIFGRLDVARLLLAHGADAALKDDGGDTALQHAIREQQAEIAEMIKAAEDASVKAEARTEARPVAEHFTQAAEDASVNAEARTEERPVAEHFTQAAEDASVKAEARTEARPVAEQKACPLKVGDRVLTTASMMSDSEVPVRLNQDTIGTVARIDSDGDVVIDFEGVEQSQWIYSDHLAMLRLLENR